MGDDIRPDRVMCIELLIEIQRELEEDLERCETLEAMLNMSMYGVFLICGFCTGLHGEEVSLISLEAVRRYCQVKQPDDPALRHVCLAMRDKVKGETTEKDCHLIPIAAEMELGLCPRKWDGRVLEAYERLGVVSG
jgi:hypothetical protein